MRLIIVRHGLTVDNIKKIYQGHTPGKLSEEGIQQARQAALALKNEKIDAIYSSDLARAADTAKIISEFHPKTPLIITKDLRDRDVGEFTGKERIMNILLLEVKNGESADLMMNRISKFISKIYDQHKDETVLLVSHAGVYRLLLAVVMGKTLEDAKQMEKPNNTAISIIDFQGVGKYNIIKLNEDTHLRNK